MTGDDIGDRACSGPGATHYSCECGLAERARLRETVDGLARDRDRLLSENARILELERLVATYKAERDQLRAALVNIHTLQGQVCDDFLDCQHRSCASSYTAWEIADRALSGRYEPTDGELQAMDAARERRYEARRREDNRA